MFDVLITILFGIILGIGLSMPIGPISILVTTVASSSEKRTTSLLIAGFVCGELVYVIVLLAGLWDRIIAMPLLLAGVSSFGAILVILIGAQSLKNFHTRVKKIEHNQEAAASSKAMKGFFMSFCLALGNPVVVLLLSSAAQLYTETFSFADQKGFLALLFIGMELGTVIWYSALAWFVKALDSAGRERFISLINLLGGTFLLIYGVFALISSLSSFFKN